MALIPKNGNDIVFTPDFLVEQCLLFLKNFDAFNNAKTILEPAKGNGAFLKRHIAFLITMNHILGLKARMRDMESKGFWLTHCLLLNTPKEFPQSGFQLALCLIEKSENQITYFH